MLIRTSANCQTPVLAHLECPYTCSAIWPQACKRMLQYARQTSTGHTSL